MAGAHERPQEPRYNPKSFEERRLDAPAQPPRRRRKRPKKRGAPWVLLAAVAAVCAVAGAAFLLWPRQADRSAVSAQTPAGVVKGWSLRFGAGTGLLESAPASGKALLDWAGQQADQAKNAGMNALFLHVGGASGAVCRLPGWQTLPALTEHQTLFDRPDALAAFCEAAETRGLAVYAVTDSAEAKQLEALYRRYPVAGVYRLEGASYVPALAQPGGESFLSVAAGGEGAVTQLYLDTLNGTPGAVFEPAAQGDAAALGLMVSGLSREAKPALLGYTPAAQLAVTYPADGASLYTASCFIMGTSDPAQELLVNGQPVERHGTQGLFGVLVDLSPGGNTFTFSQGGTQAAVTIHRAAVSGGSGGGARPHDATVEVEPGTWVQMNNLITSLLYDPSSDSNINETLRQGAVGRVINCAETVRSGKTTWAYQLSGGDWVLAYNTTVLGAGVANASFTGASAQPLGAPAQDALGVRAPGAAADGRTELLTFAGSGTPTAYTNQIGNTLSLVFRDTDIAADFAVTGSSLVQSSEVKPFDGGCELVLHFAQPLWGHLVQYADGTVQLVLKAAPRRAQDPAKPLSGVSILLDPGHGEDDTGAMGTGGAAAPTEKDVNLAAAKAAQQRLEELGATVHMIRTDDTFLTLDERNQAISELWPDFFIAVHHNSIDLSVDANNARGTECYYFYDTGKALAESLVANVTAATGRADRSAQWGYYYVTRNTLCPAVLLEVGFMPNPAEYEDVTRETALRATGDAIARSVLACTPQ